MRNLNRFLCGIIVGSLIVWTIYLLTIDFYSITFVPYQYKHLTHIPFSGEWLNLYILALINLATILVIFCSSFVFQTKNIEVIATPICCIEESEEKVQA